MVSSVIDDTSKCNSVKIVPLSYVEHFPDKSNVGKHFTYTCINAFPNEAPSRHKNKNLARSENDFWKIITCS